MEAIWVFILSLLFFFVLYLYLQSRLSHLIEKKLHELYRRDLHKDVSEFYREMESYGALMENRINRYKNLIERHESLLQRWEKIAQELKKNKKTKDISEVIEKSLEQEQKILEILEKNLPPTLTPPQPEREIDKEVQMKTPREKPSPSPEEPNFALELITQESEKKPLKSPPVKERQNKEPENTNSWQNFFRHIGRLVLPKEEKPVDFAREVGLPKAQEPSSTVSKKMDPAELARLAEKMKNDPSSRPVVLKVLIEHKIPLPMVAHLTGIELSQLEAIRRLYRL
ncbi:MAG: hypothetical protein NZM25_02915 [Leptospiraceae bacterium]|nr:hypothetical protein [Leptospiraceae bacterium]MDW8307220.1 hypothetical protein [Leptospiraceae bacterium]